MAEEPFLSNDSHNSLIFPLTIEEGTGRPQTKHRRWTE